jgi:hypothetical protein
VVQLAHPPLPFVYRLITLLRTFKSLQQPVTPQQDGVGLGLPDGDGDGDGVLKPAQQQVIPDPGQMPNGFPPVHEHVPDGNSLQKVLQSVQLL